ncbi:prepilin peptidase [Georgenia sp. Z1491]|uniref:prepilin peptidase n=1 Tax=Georgenia sp. Z1491 TaxID=3416707 RepID=UPI003CF663D9
MGDASGAPARRARAAAFGAVGPATIGLAGVVAVLASVALLSADGSAAPHAGPGAAAGAATGAARVLWAAAGGWLAGIAVLLAVTDVRTHRLPDRLLLAAAVVVGPLLVAASVTAGAPAALMQAAAGSLVPAGVLYVVALVTPGGVGLGDVKLLLLIGAWLGYLSVPAATVGPVLGIVLGGLHSIGAVLVGRANLRSHVPLGPSLLLGAALATWLELTGGLAV